MEDRSSTRRGFTLVELLVVIAIIGLLSAVAVVSLGKVREKSRDSKRLSDILQLKKALALYYEDNGSYPYNVGWPSDCSGSTGFASTLQPLVSGGYLAKIPHDPEYPNAAWPQCYYYQSDATCGAGPDTIVHPYLLIFTTEVDQLPFRSWNSEANRWCLFPDY